MPIASIDDLQVFRESVDAANAVSELLRRPQLAADYKLRSQIARASAAICAQIAEGYGQLTDRHFAHYLAIGRGGCNEMQAHLSVAFGRRYLTETEWLEFSERYVRLGKRLTRLIQHLRREDRKERG